MFIHRLSICIFSKLIRFNLTYRSFVFKKIFVNDLLAVVKVIEHARYRMCRPALRFPDPSPSTSINFTFAHRVLDMKDVIILQEQLSWKEVFFYLVGGTAAGALSKFITAPFDRFVAPELQTKVFFTKIVQSSAQYTPIKGLSFAVKDVSKFYLGNFFQSLSLNQLFLLNMACGSIAGAASSLLLFPYVQFKAASLGQSNLVGAYRHLIFPAVLHRSMYFGFYDNLTLSSNLLSGLQLHQPFLVDFMMRLTSAQLSSGAAALLVHPFDVARKSFIPDSLLAAGQRKYSSLTHCLASIMRSEGLPALYRGIGPCLLRSLTAPALALVLYDEIKMAAVQLELPVAVMLT